MRQLLRKHVLRDLYQPHTLWGFDGPYTRMQMNDGSSLILIMSSVWRSPNRPFLCHASYAPLPTLKASDRNEVQAFTCDFFPNALGVTRRTQNDKDGVAAFSLTAVIPEERASFKLDVDSHSQRYCHSFWHPETHQKLDLTFDITENTPHSLLGPMWIARFLPIPLKWHIFSTRSRVQVEIKEGEKTLLRKEGLAHQEKNWGVGFPKAWIWCQGFDTSSDRGSLAIAGGKVTSFLQAFMIAFRSPKTHRNWDFGPASTMRVFGYSPFCELSTCRSEQGELQLTCTNPLRGTRIVIHGKADPDTFSVMSAPLPNGHTPSYCHESFQAAYHITLYEKRWFGAWTKVEELKMNNSALEFGGEWSHWWANLTPEQQERYKKDKLD